MEISGLKLPVASRVGEQIFVGNGEFLAHDNDLDNRYLYRTRAILQKNEKAAKAIAAALAKKRVLSGYEVKKLFTENE